MELNGPPPIGAAKANLTAEAEQYMQEVALNEQVIAYFRPPVTQLSFVAAKLKLTAWPLQWTSLMMGRADVGKSMMRTHH